MKYPVNSCDALQSVGKKKFGYFQSEKLIFEWVRKQCGLNKGQRHPLAFVLEALDDIAYVAGDIEDGVKKRLITLDDIQKAVGEQLFNDTLQKNKFPIPPGLDAEEPDILVQRFRIGCQGKMVESLVDIVQQKSPELLKGTCHQDLLQLSEAWQWIWPLKELVKNRLFNATEVLQLEIAGSQVIKGLLQIFADAIEDCHKSECAGGKSTSRKIYSLIPQRLRYIAQQDNTVEARLHLATDFVSGMTDDYAVSLYQRLSGVSL